MKSIILNDNYRITIINTILSIFSIGIIIFLYKFYPVKYVYFITEDQLGEYGTFFFYILSCFLLIWAMISNKKICKPGFILIVLCFFFMGMEEINWGQTILGLKSPEFLSQHTGGTLSVHNIISINPLLRILGFAVLAWSIVLPIMNSKLKWVQKLVDIIGIPIVSFYLWPLFILAGIFLIYHPLLRTDEVSEILLGLAFFIFAIDIFKTSTNIEFIIKMPWTIMIVSLLIVTVILSGIFVLNWPDFNSLRWRLNQSSVAFAQMGKYKQAEPVFEYIVDNPEFMDKETLFQYGTFLITIGKEEKAEEIFNKALIEQKNFMIKNPNSPIPNRISGCIYQMLSKNDEAKVEFNKAIQKDRIKLKNVKTDDNHAKILYSIGLTYYKMKDFISAHKHFNEAYSLASKNRLKRTIGRWVDWSKEEINKK